MFLPPALVLVLAPAVAAVGVASAAHQLQQVCNDSRTAFAAALPSTASRNSCAEYLTVNAMQRADLVPLVVVRARTAAIQFH